MLVSAITGEGVDTLLAEIEGKLAHGKITLTLRVAPDDGEGLAWLYRETEVLARKISKKGALILDVRVRAGDETRVLRQFS